jgi:hypothetical protein
MGGEPTRLTGAAGAERHYCAVHPFLTPGSQHMQRRKSGLRLHVDLSNDHAEFLR